MEKPEIKPKKHWGNLLRLMIFPFNAVLCLMSRLINLCVLKNSSKKKNKYQKLINSFPVPGGFSSTALPPSRCAAVQDLHLCPPTAASTASQLQNQPRNSQTKKIYAVSKHTHVDIFI